MQALRAFGVVLGGALLWAVTHEVLRRVAVPFPLSLVALLVAKGLPAFVVAPLAARWRLWQPALLTTVGYCLGSGISTALSSQAFVEERGMMMPLSHYAEVGVVHALSLTLMVPLHPRGYTFDPGNVLWLAAVFMMAGYAMETVGGKRPPQNAA